MKNLLLLILTWLASCSLDSSSLTPCNCAEIAANGMKEVFSNLEMSKEEGEILNKEIETKLAPCEQKSEEDSEFKKEYEKCYKEKMRNE